MDLAERARRVAARCRAFFRARQPGHFLIKARWPVEAPAVPPLMSFDLGRRLEAWLDCRLAASRPLWEAKADLDDDSVPAICPQFGIAEHSAWLGMKVRLQETTCLPVPMVSSPEDLPRLEPGEHTESNEWFLRMRDGYEYLRSRKDGSFLLAVRGTVSPMDLANALRGDELFSDFLLAPEFAHRLVALCVRALRWYYQRLVSWADGFEDGNFFLYAAWMGPRALGHLSNDAAMLCAPEIYAEFGFPYERELAGGYGMVLYHVHNEKLHFLPRLAALPGLALLEVTGDPKAPPPLQDLPRIFAATGAARLQLAGTSDEVRARIGELAARNVFLDAACRDRSDAEELVELVRERSRPLEGGEP